MALITNAARHLGLAPFLGLSLALLLALPWELACRPKDPPICAADVASDRAEEADTRELEVEVWYDVLLRGVTRRPLAVPEEATGCQHVPVAIRLSEELAAVDPRAAATKLPRHALGEADITFGDATLASDQLVWARIDAFDDGTAIGVIALARWHEKGLEIRGIGTLRAPATRVSLRLEEFGDEGSEEGIREVLVVTGEACRPGQVGACQREVYLMPLVDQHFVQAGLIEAGAPAGPARVVLRAVDEAELSDGWLRRAEVLRTVKYGGTSLVVSEHIEQSDCPPDADASECRLAETSDRVRALVWDERNSVFVADEPSAWAGAQGGEL
ncbi:MAG TPA: hypothetical protein ENJ18_03385 [Nannocystis exedens]|nr:hypothetical protein [Nannocystis exedens]